MNKNDNVNGLEINKKRNKFILYGEVIITILSLFIFFFGYDKPLFAAEKIVEFIGGYIGLSLLVILISLIKYKEPKKNTFCKKCGITIKDYEVDCDIEKIKYIGVKKQTTYQTIKSTVKGRTTYPRGGYSMRNSVFERQSETNYEINTEIPKTTQLYVYKIYYKCRNCNNHFKTVRVESPVRINEKEKL